MNKLKVLLADDHESFRRILSTFLQTQQGIEVIGEAINGQDVVKKTEALHPDLVLMDIHMPLQNGIEATRTIKNRWPSTRVFLLSMDISEGYERNTHGCADGFISKSSMKKALLSLLTQERQLLIEHGTTNTFSIS
jgi:DNA-binding NarL/FixJ family response regulator